MKINIVKHKVLIENFSYLSILRLFNMLLPIVTLPYLLKTLGKEVYGLVVYCQAIINYFVVLISFGFGMSATKEISQNRDNKTKINEIVSSVYIIKFILFIISLIILTLLLIISPKMGQYRLLYYLTMWMCFYDLISPIWFFQGIEKMKYITLINLVSRSVFVILIFIFIKSSNDYLLIPIINGIGSVISGIISMYIVFIRYKIKFKIQSYYVLRKYFIESFPIFISNLSTNLYVKTNKIIIGSFIGMADVAIYDLAEKLINLIKTPILLIGQSIFPKVVKDKRINFINKMLKYTLLIVIVGSLVCLIFSKSIIQVFGTSDMLGAVNIFNIMILSIIPITISMYYANVVLLAWGYNKEYLMVRILPNIIYILSICVLIILKHINIYNLVWTLVIIEFLVALLSYYYLRKNKILINSRAK